MDKLVEETSLIKLAELLNSFIARSEVTTSYDAFWQDLQSPERCSAYITVLVAKLLLISSGEDKNQQLGEYVRRLVSTKEQDMPADHMFNSKPFNAEQSTPPLQILIAFNATTVPNSHYYISGHTELVAGNFVFRFSLSPL